MSRLKDWYLSIPFTYHLHLLGLALVLLASALRSLLPGLRSVPQMFFIAATLLFAAGFVAWSSPTLHRYREHQGARAAVVIGHLLVLLLAAAIARNVVALALGLPPQDFDLTVSTLALLFYIPVWALVISLLLGTIAVLLYLFAIVGALLRVDSTHSIRYLAQAIGAFAICVYSAQIFQYSNDHQASLHPLVKWLALFADYQPAEVYPGVARGERVRLHENGVISYARVENDQVVIRIRDHK